MNYLDKMLQIYNFEFIRYDIEGKMEIRFKENKKVYFVENGNEFELKPRLDNLRKYIANKEGKKFTNEDLKKTEKLVFVEPPRKIKSALRINNFGGEIK